MNILKKILITLISTIFFYRTFINGVSSQFQIILYLFVPLTFLLLKYGYLTKLINNIRSKYNVKGILMSTLLFLIVLFGSLLTLFVNQTDDLSYIFRLVNIPIVILGYIFIFVLIDKYLNNEDPISTFIEMFVNVTCLYVIFSFCLAQFPGFRVSWFNIFQVSDQGISLYTNHAAYLYRIGWNGFSGFGTTFFCTLGIVFQLNLIDLKLNGNFGKQSVSEWIKIILLLVGNAFYGRIGLLVSLIVLIFYITIKLVNSLSLKLILSILTVIAFTIPVANALLKASTDSIIWLNWVLEPFESLLNEGDIGQDTMFGMYFIPTLKTLIIGDGLYTMSNGSYYMSVDVGYMRPILYFGFFFSSLTYINIFNLIKNFSDYYKFNYVFLIALTIVIFEVKGEVIFNILPLIWALNIMLNYQIEPFPTAEEFKIDNQKNLKKIH